MTLMVVSCGDKEVDQVKAEKGADGVTGALEGYVEPMSNSIAVSGTYIIQTSALFDISRIDSIPEDGVPSLQIDLLNEDGSIHSSLDIMADQKDKLKSALKAGDQTITLKFNGYDKLSTSIKSYSVSSNIEIQKKKKKSYKSKSPDEYSSEDIDALLDDYDDYMDDYLRLYKKIKSGDQTAVTDYNRLLEKVTELSEKLESTDTDKMSNEQIKRLNSISMRMGESL